MTGLQQYHVLTSSNVSERHAGGMPPSAKQEDVAGNARSITGAYLKETLKKAPRSSPAKAGAHSKKARPSRAKSRGAEADQPDLIAAK